MKDAAFRWSLLFDYYGDLLTQRQRVCFDLYYNQDLSLGEIAQEAGISRQGVHDTVARAQAALQTMEDKTGLVRRDLACRRALEKIRAAALALSEMKDEAVSTLAGEILRAVDEVKE